MRFALTSILLLIVGGGLSASAFPLKDSTPATPAELAAGQALAESLRSAIPAGDSTIRGKLRVTQHDETREVPVVCSVKVTPTNWESEYQIERTAGWGPEKLVVRHSTNGPNEYFYTRAPGAASPLPELRSIRPEELSTDLAGSDFSLADFGMEYLHWPVQRQFRDQTYSTRLCHVLDSSDPNGVGVVRIRSYIDAESGGPLSVKAYDAQGALVKSFSLGGGSLKKVNGRWQVEKVTISNNQTHSRTDLIFDLKE